MLIQKQCSKSILSETYKRDKNTQMFSIIEEAKETLLDFSKETVKVLWS